MDAWVTYRIDRGNASNSWGDIILLDGDARSLLRRRLLVMLRRIVLEEVDEDV